MPTKAKDAFRTISEVADWLDVPAHVLRFWESKFSQIKPVKRAGGRRYYRPDDMLLIGGIKRLLHDDGMTIRGVQKMLKEDGVKSVSALSPSLDNVDDTASPRTQRRKADVPDVDDPVAEAVAESAKPVTTEEDDTVAEWQADQDADAEASVTPEHRPLDISAPVEAMEEDTIAAEDEAPVEDSVEEEHSGDDVEEAPFTEVEEEPETRGGDNVVSIAARTEITPVPEPEPEPDLQAEPEPERQPEPEPVAARETTLPPAGHPAPDTAEPEAARTVQLDPGREKTLPPAAPLAEPPEPDSGAEGFQLTTAQTKALALRSLLRGTDPASLSADPALADHLTRLKALRDRMSAARDG